MIPVWLLYIKNIYGSYMSQHTTPSFSPPGMEPFDQALRRWDMSWVVGQSPLLLVNPKGMKIDPVWVFTCFSVVWAFFIFVDPEPRFGFFKPTLMSKLFRPRRKCHWQCRSEAQVNVDLLSIAVHSPNRRRSGGVQHMGQRFSWPFWLWGPTPSHAPNPVCSTTLLSPWRNQTRDPVSIGCAWKSRKSNIKMSSPLHDPFSCFPRHES